MYEVCKVSCYNTDKLMILHQSKQYLLTEGGVSWQMAISGFDPTDDPRVQLALVTRDLRHAEEKIRQIEGTLAQAHTDLGRKESEISHLRDEREDLKLKLELAKRDLKHLQEDNSSKSKASRERAINATLLLAFASGFTGYGINLLTQTPSNVTGIALLAIAIILYWIGARSTALLA
jgi:septal ring factor EnvC (AmiA/AmiB activator)